MHVNDIHDADTLRTDAVVESAEYYGLYIKYTLNAGGEQIKVIEKNSGRPLYKKGEKVTLSFNPNDIMQY